MRRDGKDIALSEEEQLALVPDFKLHPVTAALFGGERLSHYEMGFADIDANLLAIEYDDFVDAVINKREPDVTGEQGLRSLALVYGFLESECAGRALSDEELLSCKVHAYQDELM